MAVKAHVPFYRVLRAANPAAGAEFTITAPGRGYWRMTYLSFVLATSAVAANRAVTLVVDDGTDIVSAMAAGAVQIASETRRYGAFPGGTPDALSTVSGTLGWPTEGVLLLPGWRVRSLTGALDAGDQYSGIRWAVEELPTGPVTEWVPTVDTREDERS